MLLPAGRGTGKRGDARPARQHLARPAASCARACAQVFLRHLFILRYRLPFPSATATAVMINGLHTASGSANGMRQVPPPPAPPHSQHPTCAAHGAWCGTAWSSGGGLLGYSPAPGAPDARRAPPSCQAPSR